MSKICTGAAALAALALAWAASGGAAADTPAGVRAFQHGDFKRALEELSPEAEKGDPVALYALGRMHSAGLGVDKDTKQAAALFKRAAEAGYPAAQNEYGAALALGEGVEQNLDEALKWLLIAARAGNESAQEYAQRLGKYMPRSSVGEIRRQAIEWEEKNRARLRAQETPPAEAAR